MYCAGYKIVHTYLNPPREQITLIDKSLIKEAQIQFLNFEFHERINFLKTIIPLLQPCCVIFQLG
ncbi:hypothetical protein EMIT036CA2_10288 [Chryseobacterium sp. IT-36CA2]